MLNSGRSSKQRLITGIAAIPSPINEKSNHHQKLKLNSSRKQQNRDSAYREKRRETRGEGQEGGGGKGGRDARPSEGDARDPGICAIGDGALLMGRGWT